MGTEEPKHLDRRAPELTIVGGQPPRRRGRVPVPDIPEGIERLLCRAAVDAAFRARLLADRAAALEDSQPSLTPTERAILEATTDRSLEAMIARIAASADVRREHE